jgi:nitric oxide dioxygenase
MTVDCPVSGSRLAAGKTSGSGCPMASMATLSTTPEARSDPTLAIPEDYRHITLTDAQRALVKASVPVLQEHGVAITKLFYQNMLGAHNELHEIFNNANQVHLEQPKALANAVLAYAQNIDDLTPLGPAVELIAGKHASLFVRPEQYAIVGKHLIGAIATVLGDACTPELADTWTRAYWMLAEIFINREEQLYQASGRWKDWAEFRVAKKVKESDEVTSFYLEPVDESMKPLPAFLPGQVSLFSTCFVLMLGI